MLSAAPRSNEPQFYQMAQGMNVSRITSIVFEKEMLEYELLRWKAAVAVMRPHIVDRAAHPGDPIRPRDLLP